LIEPSVAGPLSALTLPSGDPESLPPPESTAAVASLVMTMVSSAASADAFASAELCGEEPDPPQAQVMTSSTPAPRSGTKGRQTIVGPQS
jgi:hypothetical protein